MGPLLVFDEYAFLSFWDHALPLAKLPYAQARLPLERLEADVWRGFVLSKFFTGLLTPRISSALARRDNTQALVAMWRLGLALKRYQAAHGQYPATLADLQKALDWKIPPDPFSGKPYVYRREGAGFLVYSVGPDMQDDGGRSQWDDKGKWHEHGDLVWRCLK